MITLIGHGYIGSAIARELDAQGEKYRWDYHTSVSRPSGAVIINAAGYVGEPNVDACEKNKEACIDGNILWPLQLERFAEYRPIVHVTSGCVYTGTMLEGGIGIAYSEEDEPNFDFTNGSFYSGCKAMFERHFRATNRDHYLLRVRLPFGPTPHPKNLLTKLAGYPRLIDQRQSISSVEDVAKVAVWFAQELPPPGIYNCVNPQAITIRRIAEIMGWTKQWMDIAEFRSIIRTPRSECELTTDKLTALYPLRTSVEALEACRGMG